MTGLIFTKMIFLKHFARSLLEANRLPGGGDHRIKVEGIEIAFSFEDPGIHISFAGEINGEIADQIVDEILKNIEATIGQSGRVVTLSWKIKWWTHISEYEYLNELLAPTRPFLISQVSKSLSGITQLLNYQITNLRNMEYENTE